ncbi:MAG: ABC transporter ATP-binding protein [Saccharofermentanales bacterium]
MIEVSDLSKRYKSYERGSSFLEVTKSLFVRKPVFVDAVKNISFKVGRGEIMGLIGPNGAGKSTTLKILTGIMYPTSGHVNILGLTPWNDRKRYVRDIGAVFGQKSQLLWDIPPIDAFLLNKAIYDIPSSEFNDILEEMQELLSIRDIIRKPTRQLSLGERMKCEFVMAMLHSPKIVFLDEPTIGLDVLAKDKIRQFIQKMNSKGITFILTTHDIGDIESLAKRVIVINHGEIVFDDSINALRGRTQSGRRIILNVQKPLNMAGTGIDGIDEYNGITEFEGEFIINTNIISIADFIAQMNIRFGISDAVVGAQPIEKLIKELYAN